MEARLSRVYCMSYDGMYRSIDRIAHIFLSYTNNALGLTSPSNKPA